MPRATKSKPSKTEPEKKRASIVTRKDGRELKRTTVYLPVDLARSLAIFCAERDVDLSDVVAEGIRGVIEKGG